MYLQEIAYAHPLITFVFEYILKNNLVSQFCIYIPKFYIYKYVAKKLNIMKKVNIFCH